MVDHPQEVQSGAVEGYRFHPRDLSCDQRPPGISAFMRIRNGDEFLELTIRSHLPHFDEIVAVYNDCSDETAAILERLQHEVGADRLRVIHYRDRVHPPGSKGHRRTASTSPNSLVNYYNFALAATRYAIATKLDDDHLAITDSLESVTRQLRSLDKPLDRMLCFSGLNLARGTDARLGVLASSPVSGAGDIGFFQVTPKTYFTHDRRFERFHRGQCRRQFCGYLYWHLKNLKRDFGFGNYQINDNPESRYAKRYQAITSKPMSVLPWNSCLLAMQVTFKQRVLSLVSEKQRLLVSRNHALSKTFCGTDTHSIVENSVDAHLFAMLNASPSHIAKSTSDGRHAA